MGKDQVMVRALILIYHHSFFFGGLNMMKVCLQGNAFFCINASVTANCKWIGHIPLVVYAEVEYLQIIWLDLTVAKIHCFILVFSQVSPLHFSIVMYVVIFSVSDV